MHEKIAVIGLGYVGLPIAVAFARHGDNVIGIDTGTDRLNELEISAQEREEIGEKLHLSDNIKAAVGCDIFIITVPTPVYADTRPNLSLLEAATRDVGSVIKPGSLIIFESTVYPGVTEEICAPILEKESALCFNRDFFCGYSPERICTGLRGLNDIIKITSGSTAAAAKKVDDLYKKIITAGTCPVASIKIAEAAKLAENIQRDADISITNQLAMIFGRMGINSAAVFSAAATKWNYRQFQPGLVGGHCIGTDSYYLLHKAQEEGINVALIAAVRQNNNAVPRFVADEALCLLKECGRPPQDAKVLMLGFSFKENSADVRHTLADKLRCHLEEAGCQLSVCDPVADASAALAEYALVLKTDIEAELAKKPHVIIFAVAHRQFAEIPSPLLGDALVMDINGIAPRADWRL